MRANDCRTASGIWSGGTSAAFGGPRPSMFTIQRTDSGQVAATPPAWPPPKEWATKPTGPPPRWRISSAMSRWIERPGEPGVERAAVAVAAEVDGHDVVAERGEPRRDAVEHPPVVVGAVQAQHERVVDATPQPHVRNVVRPRSTSSARSGSGIPTRTV